MIERFTVEEINFICIYNTKNRAALIQNLLEAVDGFDTGDPLADSELFEIAHNALDKVSKMSDAEFNELKLYPISDSEFSPNGENGAEIHPEPGGFQNAPPLFAGFFEETEVDG